MARFLIEVTHRNEPAECVRAAEIFLRTGSHFLTRADWGCKDGEHKAWIIVDVASKDDAQMIMPPAFHPQTRLVQLNTFTLTQIAELRGHHGPSV